jgi:hypothetical protein
MMTIERATRQQIYAVAVGMRSRDFDEIAALNFADNRSQLAQMLADRHANNEDVLCCAWHGFPVCVGGFLLTRPNVISLMMFATSDFPKVGLGLTRFIKKQMFPRLERAGVHRIEALSLDGYDEIHDWLRVLGLEAETKPLRNFGKNGEAFRYFSKVMDVRPAGA